MTRSLRARLAVSALALAAPLSSQVQDNWSAKVVLRIPNPHFGTENDYFAPIHVILGPTGDLMLFGFRQDVPLIGEPGTTIADFTGSMSTVLPKSALQPLPAEITLADRGEHRDLSYGVRSIAGSPPMGVSPNDGKWVESDPNDPNKAIFLDRLFCSGHVPVGDTIIAVGGLRLCRNWNTAPLPPTTPSPIVFSDLEVGGGLPYVQRWDWTMDNPSWQRLATNLAGLGNKDPRTSPPPRTSPNSADWWPETPNPMPTPPSGILGIFFGIERYYPTATVMLDGTVLVTSGHWFLQNETGPGSATPEFFPQNGSRNLSVELYDPLGNDGGGTTTVLSDSDDPLPGATLSVNSPPTIFNPEYTHVFVLPKVVNPGGYDVLMIGEEGRPVGFNTAAPDWYEGWPARESLSVHPMTGDPHTVPSNGTSTVLLPLRIAEDNNGINDFGYHNGTVLSVGGAQYLAPDPNPKRGGRKQIDAFDPITGTWTMKTDLAIERQCPSGVILPTGVIAIVGGINMRKPTPPTQPPPFTPDDAVKTAEYVDLRTTPGTLTVTSGATAMADFRAYHTAIGLMGDGKIWVGGGKEAGPPNAPFERSDFQILTPDYAKPEVARPQITFVSENVLGRANDPDPVGEYPLSTTVQVTTPNAQFPSEFEAVLISLGSHTHAFDMNQRYVQLAIIQAIATEGVPPTTSFTLTLAAPEYRWAPPGYYMLWILDKDNIPSKSAMIRLK